MISFNSKNGRLYQLHLMVVGIIGPAICLQGLEVLEGVVWLVEHKVEDRCTVLFSLANENFKIWFPGDVQGQVTSRATHLEFHVSAPLFWSFGKIEADVGQGESEGDLLLLDCAGAKQGK